MCITRLAAMPDRCEVLPGDAVVARRDGGLLWVDAPGSPALVSALHACLGVSGPGVEPCPVARVPHLTLPLTTNLIPAGFVLFTLNSIRI